MYEQPQLPSGSDNKKSTAVIRAKPVRRPDGFFKVSVEGDRELLADAGLTAFIGEPEFAVTFFTSARKHSIPESKKEECSEYEAQRVEDERSESESIQKLENDI